MSKEEPVEVCVILPFAEYRSIEQRAKKVESSEARPPRADKSVPQSLEESGSDSEQRTEPPLPQEPKRKSPIPSKVALRDPTFDSTFEREAKEFETILKYMIRRLS